MSSPEPVSWMTLTKGTPVFSSDDQEVGTVGQVVADRQKDIFSGVTISSGLLSSDRFVPAESILEMTADGVKLSLSAADAESLDTYSD